MNDVRSMDIGITGSGGVVGQGLGPYAGNQAERAAVNAGLADFRAGGGRMEAIEQPGQTQAAGPGPGPTGFQGIEQWGNQLPPMETREAPRKGMDVARDQPLSALRGAWPGPPPANTSPSAERIRGL